MIDAAIFLITVGVFLYFLYTIFPRLPRWARVGFWGGLCLLAIATDDAFFAALYALIATTEWHDQDEWSRP